MTEDNKKQIGAGCVAIVIMAIICVGIGILIDRYWL